MADFLTPFLGGTGFGQRPMIEADAELARPFAPGLEEQDDIAEAAPVPELAELEPEEPDEEGITAVTPLFSLAEPEEDEFAAAWDEVILMDDASTEPESLTEVEAASQPERQPEPETMPEPERAEPAPFSAEAEADFPEFLFGSDPDPGLVGQTPEPREPTRAEREALLRALAERLRGHSTDEIIARAFEAGFDAAREEGQE